MGDSVCCSTIEAYFTKKKIISLTASFYTANGEVVMIKVKLFGLPVLLISMIFFLAGCEISPPSKGEKLSEVEQLYNQSNFKDAMNVARYNLKNNPKDPASVVTVWKTQVLQGTKSKVYVQQLFKAVKERVPEFGNGLIPFLGRGVLVDSHNTVRLFCLLCLGELPDVSSSDLIAKVFDPGYILGDKPSDVTLDCLRGEAGLVLGKRKYSQVYEGIIALTESEDGEVRGNAAMALGYLGDERALPKLEELTKDEFKLRGARYVAEKADSAISLIKGE